MEHHDVDVMRMRKEIFFWIFRDFYFFAITSLVHRWIEKREAARSARQE